MTQLESLAEENSIPSLLDHLSVYAAEQPLIYWHDAFENLLRVAGMLAENVVASFAKDLGQSYRHG